MCKGGFEKGQFVVYGTNGICMIEDMTEMSFVTGEPKAPYYMLKPETANASTVFVPVNNEILVSKMRPLMTKEEIDSLLLGMKDKELAWENDRRVRNDSFHDILVKGVTQELLLMIRCIYVKKNELEENNKKLSSADMNALKSAEKLVEEEFAHVLQIKRNEVGKYIRELLKTRTL